ncbi:histidine kinase N-terminal 7TM domain-containing protein [Halorientalis halophila]|uniref:histidine kinase N-terminal 7TM domain-containing protein n=1 Tax=Halorientalis halophila TaxID=3108499 RepID=UPI00300817A8
MWQYTPYTVPLILVALLGAAVAVLTWRQGDSKAETWFVAVVLSVSAWAFAQLLIVSAADQATAEVLVRFGSPVAIFLPISLTVFTLHYTGRSDLVTPRRVRALLLLPFATAAVAVLGDALAIDLARVHLDARMVDAGSYDRLEYAFGPIAYFAAGLSWVMVLGCIVLLYKKFRRSRNVYRKLSALFIVTFVVQLSASVATFTGLSPVPHMLALPFTFLVFGTIALLTTVSVRFLRMIPLDRLLSRLGSDSVVLMARDFVVEEMDAGVLVLDADHRIVDINETAKEMMGVNRPVGRSVAAVVDVDAIVDGGPLLDVLRGDRELTAITDELWIDGADGERCYEVTVSPLTDRETVVGHVVMLHDITRQKRRERVLRDREQELEAQKENLVQQTTKLEHQNERLDEFAGIVSHDLRNPLNVSDGTVELCLHRADPDAETVEVPVEHLETIRDANQRMGAIVDDALTLARQGKAITETESVDLADLAERAWANVDTADATLEADLDLRVPADPDRLLNVFENCFRNAVEHGSTGNRTESDDPDGRAGVTVTLGEIDREAGTGFFVADDGAGIPDEEKSDVLDHGYTTSDDGTGLGLSIVTDVASAHGWEVRVTDSESGGARFEFVGVGGDSVGDHSIDAVLEAADSRSDPAPGTQTRAPDED